jgi:thioredoxin 1
MNPEEPRNTGFEIDQTSFEAEVLRSSSPVLAAFYASWSRPCHILDSVLAEVAKACERSLKVVKINADDNPELGLWYGVQSVPTLLYFVGGNVRAKLVGTASKEAIMAKLQGASPGASFSSPTTSGSNQPQVGS